MPLPRPTARRKLLPKPALPVAQRLRQRRHAVASPGFAARLRAPRVADAGAAGRIAVAALLGGLGGAGLFLGWLQASLALAAGALVPAAAGAWLAMRVRRDSAAGVVTGAISIDPSDAERLDALIEACAPELPDAAVAALISLAATLGRMAPGLRGAGPPGHPWRQEDSFFIGELLRRYVPDSVQRYLDIPGPQRTLVRLDDGSTPAQALCVQLDGLVHELAGKEELLARACSEGLVLQGAFLDARRKE